MKDLFESSLAFTRLFFLAGGMICCGCAQKKTQVVVVREQVRAPSSSYVKLATVDLHPSNPPNGVGVTSDAGVVASDNVAAPVMDFLYGTPIANQPGFYLSPYAPDAGPVDARGFAPGTEVRDPHTGKTFIVPVR